MKALLLICFALIFINLSSAVKLSPPKFDQDVCFIHSYPKGVPQEVTLVTDCKEGYERISNTCKAKCRQGYVSDERSGICHTPCPREFGMLSGECFRDDLIKKPIYFHRRDGGKAKCEDMHGKCGDSTTPDFYEPYCTTSYRLDTTNICLPEVHSRDESAVIKTLRCPDGLEKVDGYCYPPCDNGFTSVGDICTEPCPKGYLRCGNVCTNRKSCEDGKVQNIQSFVYAIEEAALKASIDVDMGQMMCW